MNPERLLQHFERISEAPDAIPRLRRFILDLAVRGKLVEQDPNDEPAAELLKRIQTDKTRLIKEGRLRRYVGSEEAEWEDFLLPRGWVLTTLGELALKITDGAHKTPTYLSEGVPFVSVKDFSGSKLDLSNTRFISPEEHRILYQRCDPRRGDILIGRIGTLGKAVLVDTDVEFSLFVSVGLIRFSANYTVPIFLQFLLNSPLVEAEFDRIKVGGGTHTNKLNLGDLHTIVLPLPPFAEQHRIVTKVDELMALCDQLEAAKTEREQSRDRMVAASLHRLNSPDDTAETDAPDLPARQADTFRDHARFVFNHLPRLTTRTEHIKQLRQTILNLAVRGKLVSQDPNDEPALVLHQRLVAEVQSYAVQYAITPPRLDSFAEQTAPSAAPHGWLWTRLASLFKFITDGDHQPPPKSENGVAFLTIGNVTTGRLDFSNCRFVPKNYFNSIAPYRRPTKGDILYTVVGATYGRAALVDTDRAFCVQRHIGILKPTSQVDLKYLRILLTSPLVYEQATRSLTGTAQPTIPIRALRNFVVPLPPLAEQHRIVARVDELMALCDQLESQLTTTEADSRRLLEAMLHEALNPLAEVTEQGGRLQAGSMPHKIDSLHAESVQ